MTLNILKYKYTGSSKNWFQILTYFVLQVRNVEQRVIMWRDL